MAELLEVAELVKVAVEDERTGVAFYTRLAHKSDKLKNVFTKLAEEERRHQMRFEEMLADLGGVKPREQYAGEYTAYLKALTNSRAFPDDATAIRMADECSDDSEALLLANRFERDTLILMGEMRKLLPAKSSEIVEELVAEEQSHLVALAEARQELD